MGPGSSARRRSRDDILLEIVDAAFAASARAAGRSCACRIGCTECCMGPFAVTALDAWRLREGIALLARADPRAAESVRARALSAVEQLRPGFPGDPATGALRDDKEAEEAFCDRHAAMPCPALHPETGACQLYEWRPISCRTCGPPIRFGEQVLAPCHLWFAGAPAGCIEAARVEPDPEDRERDLLEAMDVEGQNVETFVAFALVDRG